MRAKEDTKNHAVIGEFGVLVFLDWKSVTKCFEQLTEIPEKKTPCRIKYNALD